MTDKTPRTCLHCGNKSMVPHGGGFKCRDCGAEEPGAARFVEGIGPPLVQIREDYTGLLDSSHSRSRSRMAKDVLALIAEIELLDGKVTRLCANLAEIAKYVDTAGRPVLAIMARQDLVGEA